MTGTRAGLRVCAMAGSALFEDLGRRSIDSGVPMSGAFDRTAHWTANALVGDPPTSASLEITGSVELEALATLTIAVTGSAAVSVAGRPTSASMALVVAPGERISVAAHGRAYLGVAGGFRAAEVLGSRSTCVLGPIGPPPIGVGDLLPVAAPPLVTTAGDFCRPERRASGIRVVPGPHARPRAAWVEVLDASRIGLRLGGGRTDEPPGQLPSDGSALPSVGVLPGAIQMLPSGDWMLLGPDAGTMGGYPVVGVVLTDDLGAAAQLRVGDRVRLVPHDRPSPDPIMPTIVRMSRPRY